MQQAVLPSPMNRGGPYRRPRTLPMRLLHRRDANSRLPASRWDGCSARSRIAPCDNRHHKPCSAAERTNSVSVLDDVRGLEQRVIARLRELRPLIEEYEELNRIAGQLGLD